MCDQVHVKSAADDSNCCPYALRESDIIGLRQPAGKSVLIKKYDGHDSDDRGNFGEQAVPYRAQPASFLRGDLRRGHRLLDRKGYRVLPIFPRETEHSAGSLRRYSDRKLLDGWRDLLADKIHTRKIFLRVVVRSPLPRFTVE